MSKVWTRVALTRRIRSGPNTPLAYRRPRYPLFGCVPAESDPVSPDDCRLRQPCSLRNRHWTSASCLQNPLSLCTSVSARIFPINPISILAVACGGDDWSDLNMCKNKRRAWLAVFLEHSMELRREFGPLDRIRVCCLNAGAARRRTDRHRRQDSAAFSVEEVGDAVSGRDVIRQPTVGERHIRATLEQNDVSVFGKTTRTSSRRSSTSHTTNNQQFHDRDSDMVKTVNQPYRRRCASCRRALVSRNREVAIAVHLPVHGHGQCRIRDGKIPCHG